MRLPPLFKFGPRARSTSWGIALCTMFIVASFSVVDGLGVSMDTLQDNFNSDYSLLVSSDESYLAYFEKGSLGDFEDRVAYGVYNEILGVDADIRHQVFALDDPHGILPESFSVSGNQVLAGLDLNVSGGLSLEGTNVTVIGKFSSTIFSPAWLLCSMDLMEGFTDRPGERNFAIAGQLTRAEVSEIESLGFSVVEMVGIVQFLDSGMDEIETNAIWVLVPSSFVIAVLAYSFLGMETADRAHDIGILKTVGAGRRKILSYLLFNALAMSAWGAALGLALGIVLSYGVSTLASAMFTSVFTVHASEWILALSFLATVGAGCVGALFPALRMTLTSPVHDLKEGETRY
ncbi:MAG: ABC transporter permease [Thermoplasmata archaeon]|nr:ABC transporter permease [Thermoplasmata archaeon]